jgi:hypothetical protein
MYCYAAVIFGWTFVSQTLHICVHTVIMITVRLFTLLSTLQDVNITQCCVVESSRIVESDCINQLVTF